MTKVKKSKHTKKSFKDTQINPKPSANVEPEMILAALLALLGVIVPIYSVLSNNSTILFGGLFIAPSAIFGMLCVWQVMKYSIAIPLYARIVLWILTFAIAFIAISWIGGNILAIALMTIPFFSVLALLLPLSGMVSLLLSARNSNVS